MSSRVHLCPSRRDHDAKYDRNTNDIADIIEYLEAEDSLTNTTRDLISALRHGPVLPQRTRSGTRQYGVAPSEATTVPSQTSWGDDKHFANVKSAVIAAIKRAGVTNKRVDAFPNMSKSFQELYDAVPDRLLGYKLSRFFRHCSKQGLEPKDVTDSTVSEFEDDLIKETLHKEPSKVAREAVLTWNKMKSVVPGWPDITLRRVAARVPWTIPLEQFQRPCSRTSMPGASVLKCRTCSMKTPQCVHAVL